MDLARPIPAKFTEAQDVALDLVEQRRPQRRLELRAHEARPPGVHQRDRCAVVVHVVPVRVEPVASRAAPHIEDPKHALALAPPVADRPAHPRVHVLAAEVRGRRFVDRARQPREVDLAVVGVHLAEDVALAGFDETLAVI